MNIVNDILEGIKADREYVSFAKNSYLEIASVYYARKQELLDEMSEVVKSAEAYQQTLDDETVVEETTWSKYTEASLFESNLDDVMGDLSYELGVERNGSEFWEPSTC